MKFTYNEYREILKLIDKHRAWYLENKEFKFHKDWQQQRVDNWNKLVKESGIVFYIEYYEPEETTSTMS